MCTIPSRMRTIMDMVFLSVTFFGETITVTSATIGAISNSDCRSGGDYDSVQFTSVISSPCYCTMFLKGIQSVNLQQLYFYPQAACSQNYSLSHAVMDLRGQVNLSIEITSEYIRVYKLLHNGLYQLTMDVLTPVLFIDASFAYSGPVTCSREQNWRYHLPFIEATDLLDLVNRVDYYNNSADSFVLYPLNGLISSHNNYAIYLYPDAQESTCYWQCQGYCSMSFNWQLNNMELKGDKGSSGKVSLSSTGAKIYRRNCAVPGLYEPNSYLLDVYVHIYSDQVTIRSMILNCSKATDQDPLPGLPTTNSSTETTTNQLLLIVLSVCLCVVTVIAVISTVLCIVFTRRERRDKAYYSQNVSPANQSNTEHPYSTLSPLNLSTSPAKVSAPRAEAMVIPENPEISNRDAHMVYNHSQRASNYVTVNSSEMPENPEIPNQDAVYHSSQRSSNYEEVDDSAIVMNVKML